MFGLFGSDEEIHVLKIENAQLREELKLYQGRCRELDDEMWKLEKELDELQRDNDTIRQALADKITNVILNFESMTKVDEEEDAAKEMENHLNSIRKAGV